MDNHRPFQNYLETQVTFPTNSAITPEATKLFEKAQIGIINYAGDSDLIMAAWRDFIATDCRPYAFAGAAEVILAASFGHNSYSEPAGLKLAWTWLKKAQAIAPDRPEINIIGARIAMDERDFRHARKILDQVREVSDPFFHYAFIEVVYARKTTNLAHFDLWYNIAAANCQYLQQELPLLRNAAGFNMDIKRWKEAIRLYLAYMEGDDSNAWMWNNLSICYYSIGDYANAELANGRALSFGEFGAAIAMRDELARRKPREGKRGIIGKRVAGI